jgi:hypothetical protein
MGDEVSLPFVSKSIRKIDATGSVIEEQSYMVQARTITEAVKAYEQIRRSEEVKRGVKNMKRRGVGHGEE